MADSDAPTQRFPIAVIGAAAGGTLALRQFFAALPPDSGVGFVVVMQLPAERESHLARVIQSMTKLRVVQLEDGQPVVPNTVHVGPPGAHITLRGGALHLASADAQMPLDWTLRSLAEDRGELGVAIILSGCGDEGMAGLLEVKSHGGVALVQDPASASTPSDSAALTRHADVVLPPAELARALARHAGGALLRTGDEPSDAPPQIASIITLLRHRTRYDFEPYKRGTLVRRIRRRMRLRHIHDLDHYVALLEADRDELDALARDLLIRVTHFFRDPEAWDALRDQALAPLVDAAEPNSSLRIWVAGCATGEEAYTLAMLLLELSSARNDKALRLQVFATDIGDQAAAIGREGVYADSGVTELSPERLARFFVRLADGRYQVGKTLRECVVFAERDLVSDPPFSRMDLIVCRNVLIYLEPEIQQKIIALFHFGLVPGGYLFLGPAETVGSQDDLFVALDERWRLFQRVGATRLRRAQFPGAVPVARALEPVGDPAAPRESSFARVAQQILLERFAPASVLISAEYEILYYCGPTHRFLTQPGGVPMQSLVELAGEPLRSKIRAAVHRAMQHAEDVSLVGLGGADDARPVKVTVSPIPPRRHGPQATTLLVTFEDIDLTGAAAGRRDVDLDDTVITRLEHELGVAREDLQASSEQLGTSNEEFKAANEDVTSMNEELQSTNEELERRVDERSALVRLLCDAAVIANESSGLAGGMTKAIARVASELGYQGGHVWRPGEGDRLVDAGIWWFDTSWADADTLADRLAGHALEPGVGLAQRARLSAAPAWTGSVDEVGWLDKPILRRWPIRAALAIPMIVGGQLFGVIELLSSDGAPIPHENLDVIAAVGEQLGRILERDLAQQTARALALELTEVEQRERTRVADVLHDEVGQLLTAARIKLGLLAADRGAGLDATISEVVGYLDAALDATRTLTRDLSQAPLAVLGFADALAWLIADAGKRFGLTVELVEGAGLADVGPLGERVGGVLFRCLRELLHNAAKHSGTDEVRVEAAAVDDVLVVVVHDAGCGFDPRATQPDRRGLRTMAERVRAVGGELVLASGDGAGTSATVRLPLGAAPLR